MGKAGSKKRGKAFAFPRFLELISQNAHLFSDFLPEWCPCDAADAGFLERNIHFIADFTHCQNHLIRRDSRTDARQCHIRAGHSDHRARRVTLDARHLDQTGNRVADQPQHAFDSDCRRMADGLCAAAAQIAQCRRAHSTCRADFRLTAARCAGNRRFCGDDLTLDEEDLETGASAWKDLEKEGIRTSDAVLCFSPEKKLALKDPLDIPAGRISALCGASGCGKTSFIKTLIGFYPYEGDISIAGAPLNAYSKKYLREQIAYLSQQNILIAGSIKENLLIGGHAAVTEEEIKEALRICTCDEWLGDMPDGLDTMLDEGGLRLSGGQRQMLIIARALLQKKPILLMDETFSAIDKKRSVRIIENIRRAYPEKTILLISHEEEIVRCCDEQVMVSSM